MLTSWSEALTPAALSIASVSMRPGRAGFPFFGPPPRAYSIRARWVKPRLPPSPTTLQQRLLASTLSASLALSPTSDWDSVEALT